MTKRRILLKIEIFVLIFAVILGSVTFVMRNKNKGYSHTSFYEKSNNFDVLFFGTSHIHSSFNPLQLYNKYGIVSYCKSGGAQIFKLTSEIIKEALPLSSPKLIVVDLYEMSKMIGNQRLLKEERPWMHTSIDDIPFSFSKMKLINNYLKYRNDDFSFFIECYTPLFLYHSSWNKLSKRDFFHLDYNKGFYPQYTEFYLKKPNILPHTIKSQFTYEYENILKEIIDYSKKQNIKLLLTVVPYSDKNTIKEQKYYNEIPLLLEKEDVNFINYFHHLDELNLNFSTDFRDDDHLNFYGAQKITNHIGKYIKEHYDIPDRRLDPTYTKWNEDYKLYVQDTFSQELNATKNSEKYLELLTNKKEATNNTCIFVVKTSEKNINSKHFNSLGINVNTNNCIAIIDEGKVVYNRTASDVLLQHEYKIGRLPIKLVSDVKGKNSSIKINGIEQINNKSGITVVIYDKLLKKVSSVRSL